MTMLYLPPATAKSTMEVLQPPTNGLSSFVCDKSAKLI